MSQSIATDRTITTIMSAVPLSDMKETSLDDFASGSDEAGTESEGETSAVDTEAVEQTADSEPAEQATTPEQVAAATSSSQWSPDGIACNSCGEVVERLWVDEGNRVCAACKDWS